MLFDARKENKVILQNSYLYLSSLVYTFLLFCTIQSLTTLYHSQNQIGTDNVEYLINTLRRNAVRIRCLDPIFESYVVYFNIDIDYD